MAAAHIIHMCLFKKEQKIVVVSQRQIDAADVLKIEIHGLADRERRGE